MSGLAEQEVVAYFYYLFVFSVRGTRYGRNALALFYPSEGGGLISYSMAHPKTQKIDFEQNNDNTTR